MPKPTDMPQTADPSEVFGLMWEAMQPSLALFIPIALGAGLLMQIVIPLINGATAAAVAELLAGRRPGVLQSYAAIQGNLWKLLVTGLLVSVIVSVGTIVGLPACIIGGPILALLLTAWFLLYAPAAALEGEWGVGALKRARALIGSEWLPGIGIYLLMMIIAHAVSSLASSPVRAVVQTSGESMAGTIVMSLGFTGAGLAAMALHPLQPVAVALIYFRRRAIEQQGAIIQSQPTGKLPPA